jgi:putative membrane protein
LRFLKTLFWIVIAVLVTLFAAQNWRDVTIDLWGNLQADVKIPVLLLIVFLIGFLPTLLIYRARLWRLENRLAVPQRQPAPEVPDEVGRPA